MPCDSKQSETEIQRAVKRLEDALRDRNVQVIIAPNGAIAFRGDWQSGGVSDVCAYRRLASAGSFALRKAIAQAENASGRKVSEGAIGAGFHSHDGGRTFGRE